MFNFLSRLFIKNHDQLDLPEVRRSYGTLCAVLAIAFNIILVFAKLLTANLSGSFAIRADAINNLTDAGSGILLILAFLFAGMKPRPDRPFGHGRIEYIAGLTVAVLIILCGIETAQDAIAHIRQPAELSFSWLTIGVLAGSIAVKLYVSHFTISTGKRINSEALTASGLESMADTISTFATVVSMCLFQFTPNHLNLDGWFALFVSILILKAGIGSAKETLFQLLGTAPDPKLVQQIHDICMKYDQVVGIHDLVIHDYGPGRLHVSVHCEMPGNGDIYELHDTTDQIMRELDQALNCESVVHLDPICTDDNHVNAMKKELEKALKALDSDVKIHDFRIVEGPTHTNVIFDCLVPHHVERDNKKAEEKVRSIAQGLWKNTFAIIKIDRPYC